jgi:drug/metabolite transporter (DMT)-like permease
MLLLALFIIQGLTYLSPKVLDEWGYAAQRWAYLAVLFGAAGIGSTWRWLRSGERTTRLGVALGFGLGASNIAATALQLAAIAALPGIIVFPVTSLGPMALGTALGIVVWGERPARRALAGALIALPAVLLLSL